MAAAEGDQSVTPAAAAADEPNLIKPNFPRYPRAMLRKGASGYVLVQFGLDEEGRPQDARVLLAHPKDGFEETVLKFLRKLRYEVPAEWAARHPNRIVELGFVFLINSCTEANLFPGVTSITVTAWRRDHPSYNECHVASGRSTDAPRGTGVE
jgi:TonB family protein